MQRYEKLCKLQVRIEEQLRTAEDVKIRKRLKSELSVVLEEMRLEKLAKIQRHQERNDRQDHTNKLADSAIEAAKAACADLTAKEQQRFWRRLADSALQERFRCILARNAAESGQPPRHNT